MWSTNKITGTAEYLAPELLSKNSKFDEKVDTWSLGLMLYELLLHGSFFDQATPREVIRAIKSFEEIDFKKLACHNISFEAQDLLD